MPVNDEILDAQILRDINLQRYSKATARKMVRLLTETEADLLEKLAGRLARIKERGYDKGPETTARIKSLIKTLEDTRLDAFNKLDEALPQELIALAQQESAFQIKMLEGAIPVAVDLNSPNLNSIKAIINKRPFQGRLLRGWVKDLSSDEKRMLRKQINIGLIEGETTPQVMRRVRDRLNVTTRHATALTRTAVNHVANQARSDVALANSDVVKGKMWVSTLDSRTTPICQRRDGKIYPLSSNIAPPAHINCRSGLTFITKSWKELGINLKEAPPGIRSSMNGQVPADMTYDGWLRTQSVPVQNDVLGIKKAALFRKGDLDIKRFSDKAGSEFTLDDLKVREPEAWTKAFKNNV